MINGGQLVIVNGERVMVNEWFMITIGELIVIVS